jgi:hypothetical protein
MEILTSIAIMVILFAEVWLTPAVFFGWLDAAFYTSPYTSRFSAEEYRRHLKQIGFVALITVVWAIITPWVIEQLVDSTNIRFNWWNIISTWHITHVMFALVTFKVVWCWRRIHELRSPRFAR